MPISIESIIDRQLRRWEHDRRMTPAPETGRTPRPSMQPVITLSRQHGSSGREIADRLAERFGYTLLHRNVIDRISESTGLKQRLLSALDEHSRSELASWFDSILSGKFIDEHDYVVGLLETVYSIARLGGVVVVGRGANFIIGPDRGVHLRVVGPVAGRVWNLARRRKISESVAAHEIETVDRERAKFIRKLFARSVDDPLAYDLVINEAGVGFEAAVDIAAAVVEDKIRRLCATPLSQPAKA